MEALKGLYHADKLDEKSFIENFTIRLKYYQQIIDNLLQQKKKPLQHFLITGKRGMGKSTLLRRIYIEATKDPLAEKLFAVKLGAEQYRLSRLFKLWEMVIEELGNSEPQLLDKKKELGKSKQYEESLLPIINDLLTKNEKTLLLLIDNFDQFIEKIPLKDQHALREALMLYPIQIIGNTVFYNESFKSYNNPFFDFFKPVHLDNLNKEEAEEFIKTRAKGEDIENFNEIFKNQKGKISALRILSGGVPRTLLILLSIVSQKNTGDAVDYLHEMIEQVTPLYQDRMKALSSQQQEIMHHLAMHWDRTPVKELAKEMRIPSKSISAQLVQLEKSGYIKKVDVPGRNHYYEIDERFFNIWLLMSEASPYDTKRVIWLTKWLDAFYSRDELKDFAGFCQTGLRKAKAANRFLIAQALGESEKLSGDYKRLIVKNTLTDLEDKIFEVKTWANSFDKKLSDKEITLQEEIKLLINNEDYKNALQKLELLQISNEVLALNGKGYLYSMQNNMSEAEKYFQMAVERDNVNAMLSLGYLYENKKKDILGAEKYFQMAVEKDNVNAMLSLGYLYENEKKDILRAEKYYQMGVEKGDVDSMYNLASLYQHKKKDIEGAEKYYRMGVEKGDVDSMFGLGYLYENEKKDMAEAEKYYQMAVERGDINSMYNLGLFYQSEKKNMAEAEKYYQMAVERGDIDSMYNLGILYQKEKKDLLGAEKYYQMAVENGDADSMFTLGLLYEEKKKDLAGAEKYYQMAIDKGDVKSMTNLGLLYEEKKKDLAGAEKYYQMAIEKGDVKAMTNLGVLYEEKKKDLAGAEKYYQMAIENYQMAIEKGDVEAMTNLGLLYEEKKKDLAGAEKYYQMAVEKGDTFSMGNLANLYFESNNITQKEKAQKLSSEAIEIANRNDIILEVIYLGILLWNEKVKEASQLMLDILNGPLHNEENMINISEALQYFLVFKQKQFLFKTFSSNTEWIDQYKPVYFALMHEMQEEYPKEYLKMTEELAEPVNEILKFVDKEREKLGIK